ncbi:MAG: type II toxin-antitoxin system ParD family antitoxin [Deltaproteobacteria bacterium]|nr:type II toxin-antitoxin system ParD family antitoxin [Deltaproteobacteria bacterium]
METMNISLPGPMKKFVEDEVSKGGYSTTSEYIRDVLREEQKRKAQEKLEALLLAGMESGRPVEMTKAEWDKVRQKALARLKSKK